MASMDFTMGSTATIETKLGKSLDDIIKTGSKAAGSPAKKKAVPVKGKAKVISVPRKKQQQGNRAGQPGARVATATKGKGNVQSRLQKVAGARPIGRPAAKGNKNAAANGRIQAQQAASQAARDATLAKRRGVQTSTLKGRLTPANPITVGRMTSIANRVRPAGQKQATVLQGVRTTPAQRNSEPMKFKITIQNDGSGNGKGRGNQPMINMPGGGNHNTKSMLRGTNTGAGVAGRLTAASNGGRAALPGPGKPLSERFSLLSQSAKASNGLRRGGDQGSKVNRNAAGVVMPF